MIIQPKDAFRPGDGITTVPSIEGPIVVEQRGTQLRVLRISDALIAGMNERRKVRFAHDLVALTGESLDRILLGLNMVQEQNKLLGSLTRAQVERFPVSEIGVWQEENLEWWWNIDRGEFYYAHEYSYHCPVDNVSDEIKAFFLAGQPYYSEEFMNEESSDWGFFGHEANFAAWVVREYNRIMGK